MMACSGGTPKLDGWMATVSYKKLHDEEDKTGSVVVDVTLMMDSINMTVPDRSLH
jgi:hypothetical protein